MSAMLQMLFGSLGVKPEEITAQVNLAQEKVAEVVAMQREQTELLREILYTLCSYSNPLLGLEYEDTGETDRLRAHAYRAQQDALERGEFEPGEISDWKGETDAGN